MCGGVERDDQDAVRVVLLGIAEGGFYQAERGVQKDEFRTVTLALGTV